MFSRPKILFLVSLLFVALLNPKFNSYFLLNFKFIIFNQARAWFNKHSTIVKTWILIIFYLKTDLVKKSQKVIRLWPHLLHHLLHPRDKVTLVLPSDRITSRLLVD